MKHLRNPIRLVVIGALALIATACPGSPGVNKYGFAAILNADTNSEEIKYTASQTAGQPDLRVKVVEVVRIGFQDFTIVNWSSNLATGTGPVDRGWFIDSHYLIGAKSWSLYTCMEADHSDCKLWETWTAP